MLLGEVELSPLVVEPGTRGRKATKEKAAVLLP